MNKKGILIESGTNEMELLTVFMNDQLFGINVAKVQSIQQYDPERVTKLPTAEQGIAGMFLYQNTTIPLLDLEKILGFESQKKSDKEIVVVTEFNNVVNGFKVQGVNRIYRLSWQEFVPLDDMFSDNAYFTGSVHVEDSQVLVLDLEHILSEIFPDLILEEVAKDMIEKKETITREQLEILFAEDSPTMRKNVVRTLKKAGFKNITDFINGDKALEYIKKRYKNGKDENLTKTILISDIEMPIMDGLTLCKKIKDDPDLKGIYVVMFSSLITKQMIAKCNSVNAENYVTKPEVNQLINILDDRCN